MNNNNNWSGQPPHSNHVYAPQAQGHYGQPQAQMPYQQPQAQGHYGQPQAQGHYGQPQAQAPYQGPQVVQHQQPGLHQYANGVPQSPYQAAGPYTQPAQLAQHTQVPQQPKPQLGVPSFKMPVSMGGFGKKKIYMGVAGAIAIAAVSVVGVIVKNKVSGPKTAKGAIALNSVGIDKKNAQVDEMIGAMEAHARKKWRKDATWWSVNIHGVRPDATVDLTSNGGSATLTYVSTAGVTATTKKGREDSLKEYAMTGTGAKSTKIISATEAWTGFEPLPVPGCKIADVVAALNERGFDSGTVRISFDPKFGFASGWNWHVWSDDESLAGYFSMDDCAYSKTPPK